jgi:NitT/TauT family transport system substrate-binding protein
LLARPRFIAEQPKAVAGFVRAFNRALRETIANPEAVIKYVKQREPLIDEALELRRLKGMLDEFIATPGARASGLGPVDNTRLDEQVKQVSEALKLNAVPGAEQLFNSSFLPPRNERSF